MSAAVTRSAIGDGVLLRAINWNRPAESGWANTNGFYQPDLEDVLEEWPTPSPPLRFAADGPRRP